MGIFGSLQFREVMATKREEIIQAAKGLMWEVGYESMSPRQVLDASGAGQGSLYHHFQGKKDLAITALVEVSTEMRAATEDVFAPEKPPLQRIQDYLQLNRNGLQGCRLGRLANEQSIHDDQLRQPITDYFDHLEQVLTVTLKEAVEQGDLQPETPILNVVAMVVAAVQGGYILSRIHQDTSYIQKATEGAWVLLHAHIQSHHADEDP